MAINDITGDQIKSGVLSKQGRINHDLIFAKKTAQEWIDFVPEYKNMVIYDPDGWRYDDGVTLETKISYSDFVRRFSESTVLGWTWKDKN